MRGADLWLGVDAGETNTDAVVMDTRHHLVAKVKVSTTADVRSGIGTAISRVVGHRDVDPARVTRVMLGTASAIDAIAHHEGLTRVAVVRIGAPLTLALPPLATWPATLRAAVSAGERVIGGGADLRRPRGRPAGRGSPGALSGHGVATGRRGRDRRRLLAGGARSGAAGPRRSSGASSAPPRPSRSATRSAPSACWSARTRPSSTQPSGASSRTSHARSNRP
jgi:hypothetical protein